MGNCCSGNCLWGEKGYLVRDLFQTQEVIQICKSSVTLQLNFRLQCGFCTFRDVRLNTVKSPACMVRGSKAEGSCLSFFTSSPTKVTTDLYHANSRMWHCPCSRYSVFATEQCDPHKLHEA